MVVAPVRVAFVVNNMEQIQFGKMVSIPMFLCSLSQVQMTTWVVKHYRYSWKGTHRGEKRPLMSFV